MPVKQMHFVDIESGAEKLEIIKGLAQRMIDKAGADIEIKAGFDRREAIKDADFVMTQFRVGGLTARANDERIPIKYDVIGQETTGPGGFAKALRTIPVILDICKDIEELSPHAWMLNFTNPAGLVSEAVSKYSNVKSIGLCNVPVSMEMMIAEMMDCEPKELQLEVCWFKSSCLGAQGLVERRRRYANRSGKSWGWCQLQHEKYMGRAVGSCVS